MTISKEENIMNRYSLFITTGSGDEYDEWNFTVLAEDSRNFVMQCILETKKGI